METLTCIGCEHSWNDNMVDPICPKCGLSYVKLSFGTKQEFIEYLKLTLIPDLYQSEQIEMARDWEEAMHWMQH